VKIIVPMPVNKEVLAKQEFVIAILVLVVMIVLLIYEKVMS